MECIILDIDGTLWDTTGVVAEAWNIALKKFPEIDFYATSERLKPLFGKTLPEIAALAFSEQPEEKQMEIMNDCLNVEDSYLPDHPGEVFEGVPETIAKLAEKYKLCIVSNCQAGYIELTMKALGVEKYITDFECPGYTGLGKAENCRLVMERNGFTSAVYVGDTQGDAEAAKAAGIPFVFCGYGFGQPETYDYRIEKFEELLKLFA